MQPCTVQTGSRSAQALAPASTCSLRQPRQHSSKQAVQAVAAPARQGERAPRSENVGLEEAGAFYVDHTCIDCDTCRWMTPSVFSRVNNMTAVHAQPKTAEERKEAFQALLACPTYSIHSTSKDGWREAVDSFPKLVQGANSTYHCGYHSEGSYGAASYLIRRQEGNVLVDSPRFDAKLLKRIQAMGGAKYMVFSHKDDVADHAKWAEALGAQRIIHKGEITQRQGTDQCEIQLEGTGPWALPDGGEDFQIIHTPGHTEHHVVFWYAPDQALLTGDHLAFRSTGELSLMLQVNWFEVDTQLESMTSLQRSGLPVKLLLPGHGRPGAFQSAEHREAQYADLLERGG